MHSTHCVQVNLATYVLVYQFENHKSSHFDAYEQW